jgi:hypothetical protein
LSYYLFLLIVLSLSAKDSPFSYTWILRKKLRQQVGMKEQNNQGDADSFFQDDSICKRNYLMAGFRVLYSE